MKQINPVIMTLLFMAAIGVNRPATAQQPGHGLLITPDAEDGLEVSRISIPPSPEILKKAGLLVWSENSRDRWKSLPATDFDAESEAPAFVTLINFNSRGGASLSSPAVSPPTRQLTQLVGQLVMRGNGFITPPDKGLLLDGRITVRRQADEKNAEPFPEDELYITRNNRTVLALKADQGEQTIAWSGLAGLPESLKSGLPPGEYTLRAKSGGTSAAFSVADPDTVERVMRRPRELARLLGSTDDPLYIQVTAETLLAYRDENAAPSPLLADALDLLDKPASELLPTQHLLELQAEIRARLEGELKEASADRDATGIAAIDEARQAINAGQWDQALQLLSSLDGSPDQRAQGLQRLYRAVILAESGQATGDVAEKLFLEAIELLQNATPADQLRAHNNFAALLLNRVQDRAYNHAFQMASGVSNPLVAALLDWQAARDHFQAALAAAEKIDPAEVAAVRVNQAQLYATLADLLRVIALPSPGETSDESLVTIAETWAERLANLSDDGSTGEPMVQAVMHEILAHLAFRRSDGVVCLEHAERACELYLQAGSLAGCESIYRLLGLLRCDPSWHGDDEGGEQLALNNLLVSQLLSEMFRERIPLDRAGLSRAGFLARRAYVNEKLVELLIDLDRVEEALRIAELAKARALQDVLVADHNGAVGRGDECAETVDVLAGWPPGIAAIEYFVGSERAWLFVVSPDEKVKAYTLSDEHGKPIESRDLIARVHRLISDLDRLGPAEGRRIAQMSAGGGKARFEQAWQHELHWFYNTLIPAECRDSLRSAHTLVIVPHHILHYFPFTALVTEEDAAATDSTRMPLPKFFVEQPFSLVHAPSLGTWRLLREKDDRPLEQVQIVGIADFGGRASRLDGVNQEMTNMQKIFGDRIHRLVSDREATETTARALLAQPGILTISTHGQKVPDRPLEAYLMCQPDDQHDGYLRAGEIYGLEINSDLVLLNACYGGFADRSPLPGDDLFGIQRALLHSGARTVVSGLWDIYDATAPDIMNDFWQRVAAGVSAPQALSEAQRAYLKTWREFPQEPLHFLTHPYYWSVFTVAGDDRTGNIGLDK